MTETWKQFEGQVVDGKFHLEHYLGGSDHSAVFLTQSSELGIPKAAIKLIPAERGNAESQLSRWRLASKLSHPHLIRLFDMGRCELGNTAALYVLIEYAEENLSQILPQRPLTPSEARDMLAPVLDALAYIHSKGFVHGHIKPANILAHEDQLKISRDGLRRLGEPKGAPGRPGAYDPPEAVAGGSSPAGDVWSLGMTLVEALTQSLPVWQMMEPGDPGIPDTVPPPFLDIARHCLRWDPQRRWAVTDIQARVQQWSPQAPRPATARPKEAPAKRRYMVPAVAVGLFLAVVAGAKILNYHTTTRPATALAAKQAKVQPKPERETLTQETGKSIERPAAERPVPHSTAPRPASLRSESEVKAPPGGIVRGGVVQKVLPAVPQKASDTIRGTVRVGVRVGVDPAGDVTEATLDSPGPSKYFAGLALQAVRQWKFRPPKVDGRSVPSEWVLRFEFQQNALNVHPIEASP